MGEGLIARMAKAIGYPQEVPAEAESFAFVVDDHEIVARVVDDGLELRCALLSAEDAARFEGAVVRLSGFAAGRILTEEATLAWDPESRSVILWTRMKAGGDGDVRRAFEVFCESVDWWSDRVDEENLGRVGVSEMMIRP